LIRTGFLNFRCDALTLFFNISFLASDYFLCPYWNRTGCVPNFPVLFHLDFLSFFSAYQSYIKIDFFHSSPPFFPSFNFLQDPWGFPSGDAQVGLSFWGYLFLASSSRFVRIFCAGMIAAMMASRVYLGVHSLNDVVAGFLFGVLILFLWNNSYVKSLTLKWFEGKRLSLYLLIAAILLLYLIASHGAFILQGRWHAWERCWDIVIACLIFMHKFQYFSHFLFQKNSDHHGISGELGDIRQSMSLVRGNNFIFLQQCYG